MKYTVKATPTAFTKSLKYTVKLAPAAITKSLKYTTKTTPAAPTKSLQYVVTTKLYYRESKTTLPTTNAALATVYSSTDITNVATTDSVFVDLVGSNTYNIHEFANFNASQQSITLSWTGKTTKGGATSSILLQIYNFTTPGWETLATNSTVAAATAFTLSGSQTINLANYYDAKKFVWGRVYQ